MGNYFRILKYIKPYWKTLIGSIVCVLFFVIFSNVSLFSIMPFLDTLFLSDQPGIERVETQQQQEEAVRCKGQSQGCVVSILPGCGLGREPVECPAPAFYYADHCLFL